MKILMVCLGNICRSPLAEGILKNKLPDSFVVDSAGTSAHHQGELPDHRSMAIAHKYDIDISDQRSRPFSRADFACFGLIYAMDKQNYRDILSLANTDEEKKKVHLILDVLEIENKNVPDPYYGGEHGFLHVYNLLDEACEKIASTLQS
jgi:protein-tyrosine phosphatase